MLFHEDAGQGPPLLLIHGTGADATSWDPVWPLFSRERRVIRYDRRGYSRSPGPPSPSRDYYRHQADDAAELLSQLGIPSAAVLGWSAGGIVALALAVHHPGLVGRLCLYEPPLWARSHMPIGMVLRFILMMIERSLGMKRRAAERFFRMALQQSDGTNGYDRIDPRQKEQMIANGDTLFAELKSGTGEELTRGEVAAIASPTALLIGGNSAPFLKQAAERLFALCPTWTPLRVADANHLLVSASPQRFVEIVAPFV